MRAATCAHPRPPKLQLVARRKVGDQEVSQGLREACRHTRTASLCCLLSRMCKLSCGMVGHGAHGATSSICGEYAALARLPC